MNEPHDWKTDQFNWANWWIAQDDERDTQAALDELDRREREEQTRLSVLAEADEQDLLHCLHRMDGGF